MWRFIEIVLVLLNLCLQCYAYVEAVGANADLLDSESELQVALACNKGWKYHSQYLNSAGQWVSDLQSKIGCLKNKEDVLDYCKKVYPHADITNVVESTHNFVIDDWCKIGHGKCEESFIVRPYRCLVGKFQSDALLVPESCRFDHVHNSSQCVDFFSWNQTANNECEARNMALKSFAMLLPCGTDIFTGVEFVCCPKAHVVHTERFSDMTTTESNTGLAENPTDVVATTERDDYFTHFDPRSEHSAFIAAQHRLDNKHRQKVSTIMKEWGILEEKYQKMKAKNPNKADKFKLKMTDRFQRMMNALKDESAKEKKQLVLLHQQRIITAINEHKKVSLTSLVKALNANPASEETIRKSLVRLLRAFYKDRHHTIAHFNHLMSYNPEEAHREQSATVAHLVDIDRMVNDSVRMLDRYPAFKSEMLPDIEYLIDQLRQRDTLPAELADSLIPSIRPAQHHDDDQNMKDQIAESERVAFRNKIAKHHDSDDRNAVNDVDRSTIYKTALHSPSADDGVEPVVAHSQVHVHSHGEVLYNRLALTGARLSRRNMPVVVSVVVLVSLSVVTLAVLVRRHHRSAVAKQGFTPVEQQVSPEERHITKMRVNGYENPTYKYFSHK